MQDLQTPQAADLTRLTELASQPRALDEVFEGALLSLRRVLPYDLAALYELHDGVLRVRAAAGPLSNKDAVRRHELKLSDFPTIRRALDTRRPIPLEEHDHKSAEGDPYDDVLNLPPGHSCMVVPLFAGTEHLGIITLDRTVCETYDEDAVELAGTVGNIVSVAMAFSRQADELERLRTRLEHENRFLREELAGPSPASARIEHAASSAMRDTVRQARQVASSDLPVLITGETGSGKEVVAQAIHEWSPRRSKPFVKLNCAAIPEHLVESELFGHVKGAFSGATRTRLGRFATADGGTLLLDEVGDMPLAVQAKLLRVLQERTFEPVGSDSTSEVDVRIIAASHVNLQDAVREGRFREDLYYRLAVFPVVVPSLRDRGEDVVQLAESVLREVAGRTGRGPWTISPGAADLLRMQAWPGNVRQLVNVLERATIAVPRGEIGADHLGLSHEVAANDAMPGAPRMTASAGEGLPGVLPWREAERRHLVAALRMTGGKIYGPDGAAQLLDLKPTTLQSKLKKHGIDRNTV